MYELVDASVRVLKKIVPEPLVRVLRKPYHAALAALMAISYGFPARRLTVIGITGTKGKSTTAEMLFAILRAAGHTTALLSTIRFAIEDDSRPNLFKMTLAGRGFAQKFAYDAVRAGCTHLVVEITSESTLDYRHWFFALDGLIVTNIHKEHIERHGSFARYVAAKRAIVRALERSKKPVHALVANSDQAETRAFLAARVDRAIPFGAHELTHLSQNDAGVSFEYAGTAVTVPLPGSFNALNALAAIKMAEALGVPLATSAHALAALARIPGRVERIDAGQNFLAVVDYAHTPDSLAALYDAFAPRQGSGPKRRLICVLGNTGGGRDRWKRPLMGKIADDACAEVYLTNEDPYDEDPRAIVEEMAAGMARAPRIIMDRREAIRAALRLAASWAGDTQPLDRARSAGNQDIAVLISGKGTDPFIMGPKGAKTPWSDARVVREELEKLKQERAGGTM